MEKGRGLTGRMRRPAGFVFVALLVIQLLLWGYLNLFCRFVNDHDAAKVFYHTMQMWEERTLLIPGWQYMTTAEWDCAALPALPFYALTGDIVLSFGIANLLNLALFTVLLLALLRHMGLPGAAACGAASAVLLPYSLGMLRYANMLFFGASQYIYKVLLPLWLVELLTAPAAEQHRGGWRLQLCLFSALCFLTAVSSGLYVFLCGLAPVLACDAVFRLQGVGGRQRAGGAGVTGSVCVLSLAGYALQKSLGLSTLADRMDLVKLQDFFPKLGENLGGLMELAGVLPAEEVSLYTFSGGVYVLKFLFLIGVAALGLSGMRRPDSAAGETDCGAAAFGRTALAGIFLWNGFVQQMTVTSARYHLIGFVPLTVAAGAAYALRTQRANGRLRSLRVLAAAGVLAAMTAGCWHMTVSSVGNHFGDYYRALSALAEETDTDCIAVINDSASAELARVFDPERTWVSYFTTNRSLVNYDAPGAYNDRGALSDRHLLVATQLGGLDDLPEYLRPYYRKAGEVYGDTVYLAETCRLDGTAGPAAGRKTVDYPYTPGYAFDPSLDGAGAFPAGEERRVLRSPQFGAQRRRTIVTLHYAAQAAGEAARLEAEFSGTRQQPVLMPAQADSTRFEVPAGEPFAFSVTLCEGARLIIEQITFEEVE